jgi:hypothetical protein
MEPITQEQQARIDAIKAGKRPGGLSDAEWEWVRTHPVEAVTR